MKKFSKILLALVLTALVAGCQSNTSSSPSSSKDSAAQAAKDSRTEYPVTIKTYDAQGKEIEQVFERAPEKVITNNLSATEVLIELGLEDRIVGMLNPDNALSGKYKTSLEKIQQIGDKKTISQEAVLAYEPDAIIGRNMMFSDKSLGTTDFWNDNNAAVYSQKASVSTIKQSLTNITEDVKNLGLIFDVQEKAESYAEQLQTRIDAVQKKNTSADGDPKKALIMCAYNGKTFGTYKSALQESVLNHIGYTNVATGTSDLTPENLVAMDPELIIYVTSDRNQAFDKTAVDSLKADPVLASVPAVSTDQIMTISYDEFMDYGPATIDALEKINDFVNQ